jgi:hypothetical protein
VARAQALQDELAKLARSWRNTQLGHFLEKSGQVARGQFP